MTAERKIFDILINPRSSGILGPGAEKVEKDLRAILGGRVGEVMHVYGSDVEARMKEWVEKRPGRDIMVAAGDGTMQTVAGVIRHHPAIRLAPLPGGLYSIMARHFGFPPNLAETAALYRDGKVEPVDVDLCTVNDRPFLFAALIEKNSVAVFAAHEDFRDRKIAAGVLKVLKSVGGMMFGKKTEFRVRTPDGAETRHRGTLSAVFCNELRPYPNTGSLLDPQKYKDILQSMTARNRLDGGTLGFYSVHGGPVVFAKFAARLWSGSWLRPGLVGSQTATAFDILPADDSLLGRPWPIALDGDLKETTLPMAFRNIHNGLRAYRRRA